MSTAMSTAMRRIQTGNVLSAFGLGFTVPYLYVYVAQVRGLGAGAAGVALAVFATSALLLLPVTGRVMDRRGPLPVLLGAALVAAAGSVLVGLSTGAAAVIGGAAVLGGATAVVQPALSVLVVWCSAPSGRTRAYALQFFLQNLGLGIGGLAGGQIVDESRPGSFTLLFVIEAVMFLVLAGIVATVRLPRPPGVTESPDAAGGGAGGLRALLSHRAMVQLLVLAFVMFFACYGQFDSGLTAYGTSAAGVSPSALGYALAANTAVIVAAQFLVLRFVERRRRSRVMALVGLVWALAWVMAGYAGLAHAGQTVATVAFVSTYGLFGLGEALLSPTVAPLVSDLAPESMVGRYNSAFALVKQLAMALGPAVGGPMAASVHAPYIATFLLFSLGVSVLALRLGGRLTAVQDRPVPASASRVVAQHVPQQRAHDEVRLASEDGTPSPVRQAG